MSPSNLVIFHGHPAATAQLVEALPRVPASVVTAIAQHHMRRDGTGFPKLEPGSEINRLAELIGISEEFVRLAELAREERALNRNPIDELRAIAERKFSEPVVDAFVRTFQEK
jgi:response regulator RpfG family c-di-GMP phosphodiesterase